LRSCAHVQALAKLIKMQRKAMRRGSLSGVNVQKHWHPEVGCYGNAPAIPPHIDYAPRQIGGMRALHDYSVEVLPRMHRDFVEAYRLATLKLENRRSA
jgi:hypothetical protein